MKKKNFNDFLQRLTRKILITFISVKSIIMNEKKYKIIFTALCDEKNQFGFFQYCFSVTNKTA